MSREMGPHTYRRTTAPTALPVTLQEAKTRLQLVDDDSKDVEVTDLIRGAVDIVERDARRCLMPQTWLLCMDYFSHAIELKKTPVTAVNFVKYKVSGVLTAVSTSLYQTDLISEPARIKPVLGVCWPIPDCDTLNAVQIEFTTGYASASLVPMCAKGAVLAAVDSIYHKCGLSDNYWTLIERLKAFGFV